MTNEHFCMAVAPAPSSSVSPGGVWQPQNLFDQGRRVTESLGMSLPLLPHPQAVSNCHLRGWNTLPWSGVTRRHCQAERSRHFRSTGVAVPSTGRCSQNSLLMHPRSEAQPRAFALLTAGLTSTINFLCAQQQA